MKKTNILIVEDERVVAADLEDMLVDMGYHVCGRVSSGEKALVVTEAERPDLVMMDIKLEGVMDGIEAAGLIRKKYGTPVVFLTAYADESILERAKETGPLAYILKPFQARELHSTIEIALYKAKMEEKLRGANIELEQRVAERTRELREEIAERRQMEEVLREKTEHLEQVNKALTSMLDHREVEKRAIEENMLINIRKYILPYVDKLNQLNPDGEIADYINMIESNLRELVTPASNTLFAKYIDLTPTEVKIADFIRQGKSTKEIAASLHIAQSSVSSYRNSIRKKFGLLNTKTNLRSYLNSLTP